MALMSESQASFSIFSTCAANRTNKHNAAVQLYPPYMDALKGLYYGPGSLKTALPKLLDSLGVKKVLIVTGKSLNNKVSSL